MPIAGLCMTIVTLHNVVQDCRRLKRCEPDGQYLREVSPAG